MTPPRRAVPPPFASWLLRTITPEHDRDDVIAELADEFAREILRRGEDSARSWYRRQVVRSVGPILIRRLALLTSRSRPGTSMRHRLDAVMYDLSYALRQLRRAPAFTATVVVTFALGIGMNATMFGIVDEMLLRPPALVRAPDEIITLKAGSAATGFRQSTLNYPTFVALRDKAAGFSLVAATADVNIPLDRGDRATSLSGMLVTAGYFDLLGVRPERGRFIRAEEDVAPLGAPVAVISHRFWMNHFAGGDSAIGSTLQLADRLFTVVGIAPRGFTSLDFAAPDVWIPMASGGAMQFMGRDWATQASGTWLRVYARMKPRVPLDRAGADAMRVAREAAPHAFFTQPGSTFLAQPIMLARAEKQGASRRVTLLLGVMSLVVLLIACSNVANLLLARGLRRQREIAVRLALGVGRSRLIGQSIVESVVLSVLGGVAAVLVATWAGAVVRAAIFGDIANTGAAIDSRVVGFTLTVSALVGVMTALIPAWQTSRPDVAKTIASGSRDTGGRRSRTRNTLVMVQAALTLVLLAGSGLFARSVAALSEMRLGVDANRVLVASMDLRSTGRNGADANLIFAAALERVQAVPGVAMAAVGGTVPFGRSFGIDVGIAGRDSIEHVGVMDNVVTPGYLRTLGARIISGRDFSPDDRAAAPRVAIINQMLAEHEWKRRNVVGACVRVGADSLPCATIVGVVENIRRQSIFEDSSDAIFLPMDQAAKTVSYRQLVIRAADGIDAHQLIDPIRHAIQSAAPQLPYAEVHVIEDDVTVRSEMRPFRLGAGMFGAFGALALLLAAIGVYGVISYDVSQRTQEIGVRMALGARAADVARLVVGDGVRVVGLGGAAGLFCALVGSPFVAPLLYATSARDPVVYALVASVLLMVALVASLIPARRATRVDVVVALRSE